MNRIQDDDHRAESDHERPRVLLVPSKEGKSQSMDDEDDANEQKCQRQNHGGHRDGARP